MLYSLLDIARELVWIIYMSHVTYHVHIINEKQTASVLIFVFLLNILTVLLKSKIPPRLARHVSFLASALEIPILHIRRLVLQCPNRIVGMIFILISDACVPCVFHKNFFLRLQAGNFLRLVVVICSWILQGTRTSLQ